MKAADDSLQSCSAQDLLRDALQPLLNVDGYILEQEMFRNSLTLDNDDGFGAVLGRDKPSGEHHKRPTQEQGKDEPPAPPPGDVPVLFEGPGRVSFVRVHMVLH